MIVANQCAAQSPQFRVLSDQQCQQLFLAALECLSRVGMKIPNLEAQELLKKAGARVENQLVYLPPQLIQRAIADVPQMFNLWRRDGSQTIQIAPDRVYFGTGPTCSNYIEPLSGVRRKAQRGDAAMTAHVCDALPNLDYVMSLSLYSDVTPALSPVYEFVDMISNTVKPIAAWANDPATLEDIYRIASAVAGGEDNLKRRPFVLFFTTYESPLQLDTRQTANLIWAAQHGMPLVCLGGPTTGSESPAYSASALMLHLASALCTVAVVQLAKPGTAMMIGAVPSAMDLRTARPAYGSPEGVLHTAAASDLARYLGIPFMGTAGASESKLLDAQAGIEITLQIMASCLSGAGMVHDVGFLDCADIGSLEMVVMADEVIAMLKRFMRGVEVNQQTLMLDMVEKVGPGGSFLNQPKAAKLCRGEIWVPGLLDRNSYPIWEKSGSLDLQQRAKAKVANILENHQPAPLSTEVIKEIDEILIQAESRYNRD